MPIDPADAPWIANILANLADDNAKLIYADWLEDRGDARCEFLRKFVAASQSMNWAEFPQATGIAEEWLELIGYRLLSYVAQCQRPDLKDLVLRLARPALQVLRTYVRGDEALPIGASKSGHYPDLPADYSWPRGADCPAIFEGGTPLINDHLAGFVAQINLEQIAATQVGALLPKSGLLSFFCYQTNTVSAKVVHFADCHNLQRTQPPREFLEYNRPLPISRLQFFEKLELPWTDEVQPFHDALDRLWGNLDVLSANSLLGFSDGDQRYPVSESRHLICLRTRGGCMYLQIPERDLATHNFNAVTFEWFEYGRE